MAEAQPLRAAGERLRPRFEALKSLEKELIQHARIFTEPAALKLTKAEPLLKRSIPVLIILFLCVVAIARISGIIVEYSRMEAHARQTTRLAAMAGEAVLRQDEGLVYDTAGRAGVEARLSEILDSDTLQSGAFALAVRYDGRIFGATGDGAVFAGRTLSAIARMSRPSSISASTPP